MIFYDWNHVSRLANLGQSKQHKPQSTMGARWTTSSTLHSASRDRRDDENRWQVVHSHNGLVLSHATPDLHEAQQVHHSSTNQQVLSLGEHQLDFLGSETKVPNRRSWTWTVLWKRWKEGDAWHPKQEHCFRILDGRLENQLKFSTLGLCWWFVSSIG